MADQTTETVNQQKQETITKQKNPLRVEQGKRLAEYNRRKKEDLNHLNEQITKKMIWQNTNLKNQVIITYILAVLVW